MVGISARRKFYALCGGENSAIIENILTDTDVEKPYTLCTGGLERLHYNTITM